jgi:hypothetical protein
MIKTLKTVFTQRTHEGTTERLLQLSLGYFITYIATGIAPKYFLNKAPGYPAMNDVYFMVYSTALSSLFCVGLVIYWKWYRFKSQEYTTMFGVTFPKEFLYIIPSGVCTAVVIPTTTLMYLLPISVMVAMIIMRASVIVLSRIIDAIQIRQGILKKTVYWEENTGVVLALLAVGLKLYYVRPGDFDFVHNIAAMTILSSYIVAYGIRIYIMNYFKNTRTKGVPYDNKGFFAVEQISASSTMIIVTLILLFFASGNPENPKDFVVNFQNAFSDPHEQWWKAALAGVPYGIGAFFSVFLFMFQGRTATFAGLVNRLTSLIAGTIATLAVFFLMKMKPPKPEDWIALVIIFIALWFLGRSEKKRACELARSKELVLEPDTEVTCDPAGGSAPAK